MRAAIFKRAGAPWVIEELPDPSPLPGEAVMRVGRCGICGTDVTMSTDKGAAFGGERVMGHEFCGEVVAIGAGVDNLRIGDIVTALPWTGCGRCAACAAGRIALCPSHETYLGGFGEYARIGARTAMVLPSALSMTDGALVEPLAVGLHGVRLAKMAPNARILVLGGGSVGLAVAFWARRLGAGRVAVASRSRRRETAALAMGAHAFVQTGEGEAERIAEALGGAPQIVFECIGVPGALQQSISLAAVSGTVISLGFCMEPDPILPLAATVKEVTLVFSMAYTIDDFRHVIDTLDAGHLEPRGMVSSVIGLDALPAKIEAMLAGRSDDNKVHVSP